MKQYRLAAAWAVLVSVGWASFCHADTVVTTDGKTLEGRIVSQAPDGAVSMRLKYGLIAVPGERVSSIVRAETPSGPKQAAAAPIRLESSAGTACYTLPIVGEIGVEVKAEFLEKALALAGDRPHVLVLVIDSTGGSVAETERIVSALRKAKSTRTVAYVRRALSAAAVIAMACPEICMAPGGTIGAAVPYRLGPDGTPKEIQEKLKSAIRAQFRVAAEVGGHSPLIMEGMMDPAIELAVKTENGKPQVAKGGAGKILKPKGRILTLTGKQALACGLAKAVAAEPPEAYKALGLKAWHRAEWGGWLQMTIAAKKARQRLTRDSQHKAFLKKAGPQLAKIEAAMLKIQGDVKVTLATKAAIARQYGAQVAAVKYEYKQRRKRASRRALYAPREAENLRDQALRTRQSKLQSLLARYHGRVLPLTAKVNSLKAEYGRLSGQRKKLLAGAPR